MADQFDEYEVTFELVMRGSPELMIPGPDGVPVHYPYVEPDDEEDAIQTQSLRPLSENDVIVRLHNNTYTGYGQHGAHFAKEIDKYNPVAIDQIERSDCLSPCDPWIDKRVTPPDARAKLAISVPHRPINEGDVIATMWEADRIPPDAVDNCNRAAGVVVTCENIAEWFRASGVTAPVRVVPLGLDLETFHQIDIEPDGKVIFGAAGRTAHGGLRKGLGDVIDAFKLAFPVEQDVELRVKVWEDCQLPEITDGRIVVDRRSLSDAEVADWLRDCSCYVTASRGEGWGFWAHQSLAVGRPVIAPLWGGTTAYADAECSYPVEYDIVPVPDDTPHYGGYGASWCVPRLDSLVAQMRAAYSDAEHRIEKGYIGADRAAEFSWFRAGREMRDVLREFGFIK